VKRKNVSLDDATIAKALVIGKGELSRGIRRAVAEFAMDDIPVVVRVLEDDDQRRDAMANHAETSGSPLRA
jgi:hypothetical protein